MPVDSWKLLGQPPVMAGEMNQRLAFLNFAARKAPITLPRCPRHRTRLSRDNV